MDQNRALAVIVFTDISGYSALMGSDENKALALLKTNREIHQVQTAQFNGSIIKEIGDGILMRFNTVSDAVRCALAIAEQSKEVEGLHLKMGIHLGEVIEENSDVFGDGVNIASRIESIAKSGEILCSESVHRNLKNKDSITTTFVKSARLKNIDEPVKVYRVVSGEGTSKPSKKRSKTLVYAITTIVVLALGYLGITWLPVNFFSQAAAPNDLSIAVLPLDNKTPEVTQSYISDGISEEVINKLTSVDKLEVRSARQSFQFREVSDIEEAGSQLNVRYLLEGSSAQANDQLRISIRLVDLKNSSNTWSETFTYSTDSIFSIQSQLATEVLDALEIELSLEEQDDIQSQYTSSNEAWDLHLQAMEHYNNTGEYEIQQAINKWFAALKIDENFDLAARNIAAMYQLRINRYDFGIEWVDSADLILDRLLLVDPKNPSYYRTKAWGAYLKGNYSRAKKLFEEALENATGRPNLNTTKGYMRWTLMETGQIEEAFDNQLAYFRERISPNINIKMSWIPVLSIINETEYAKSILAKLAKEDPENPEIAMSALQLSIFSGENLGENMRKVDSIARKLDLSDSRIQFIRGMTRFAAGEEEQALHFFETSVDVRERTFADPHIYLAHIYKKQSQQSISIEGEETTSQKKFRENLQKAESRIEEWRKLGDESYSVHYNLAAIALLKGDRESALNQLDSTFIAGYRFNVLLEIDPLWSEIRDSDRFQSIIAQINNERTKAAENIREKYNVNNISDIPGLSEETFDKRVLYGIGISYDEDTNIIDYTVDGSPAEKAGLKSGDKLIAVAKGNRRFTKLEDIAQRDHWRYFQLPPGETTLRFQIERKGQKDLLEISMEKEIVIFEPTGD